MKTKDYIVEIPCKQKILKAKNVRIPCKQKINILEQKIKVINISRIIKSNTY